MKAHLLVLTPSLGRVSLGYRDTFAAVMLECARRGIKLSMNDVIDPGLLPHARNVLLAAALESDATHVFWWDADVAFEASALFECLEWPEEMICRPYPMRGHDFESQHEWLLDRLSQSVPTVEELRNATMLWSVLLHYENGEPRWLWTSDCSRRRVVEVTHCGFGWVLMKGEALRAAFSLPSLKDWHERRYHHAFNHGLNEQDGLMGEDVSFCTVWRQYGGLNRRTIWAAPDAVITNGGRSGRYADFLSAQGLWT